MTGQPGLHFLCGKIAAGKSTLAAQLAADPGTLLISEDEWLATLYPTNETLEDYRRTSALLKKAMGPHIIRLLDTGLSVVLDFPANTRKQRAWMRGLADGSDIPHTLHYLDMSDEACLSRLHRRNAANAHQYYVTDEQFAQFTSYFEPPSEDEGFTIKRYEAD